jgi:glycosyltransferase involved in cell wall biosynthesis
MKDIIYIHGRPSGHPIHDAYAKSIDAEFLPEDFLVPYLLKNSQNKILRYISWILNSIYLTLFRRKYKLVLTESVRIPLYIASKFLFYPSRILKVALMADETLYFTHSKKYPKATQWLMKQYFIEMDYLICIGAYQEELAKKILPTSHHHKIKKIFNGLSESKMEILKKIKPSFDENNWVFVGNINVPFRVYYKGVDLMLESLSFIEKTITWNLDIVGECPIEIQQELLKNVPESIHKRIRFLGLQNIDNIISNYNLCIHVARGEAWGMVINEMTAAGIPTIVSNETGTKEIIEKIDSSFVVPLSANIIAQKITDYAQTTLDIKQKLSQKNKEISQLYTEQKAKELFVEIIKGIITNY